MNAISMTTIDWVPNDSPQGIANKLRSLYEARYQVACPPVSVTLTGKAPGRRLGWYDVKRNHIYINDKGQSGRSIIATLVHEIAHEIQFTCDLTEGTNRLLGPGSSHGPNFRIQHWRLRALAVEAGIMCPIEELDAQLASSAQTIRGLRPRGGQYVLDVGKELAAARKRCWSINESFECFLQECVSMHRSTAFEYIRAFELNLPPALNFTTSRFLMRLKDDLVRQRAIKDALAGVPLDVLRIRYGTLRKKPVPDDELARLLAERAELLRRLEVVEARIKTIMNGATQEAASTVRQSDNPTPSLATDRGTETAGSSVARKHTCLNLCIASRLSVPIRAVATPRDLEISNESSDPIGIDPLPEAREQVVVRRARIHHPTLTDATAFAQASERLLKRVRKVLQYKNRRWRLPANELEDVAGEVLLRMSEKWDAVPVDKGLHAFCRTLSEHAFWGYLRFKNRQTVIDPMAVSEAKTRTKAKRLTSTLMSLAGQRPSSQAGVELAVIGSDLETDQGRGLRIMMRHWQDSFPMKEVSRMEGASIGTCYQEARQTRETIRARYRELAEY